MEQAASYRCATCGQIHDGLPDMGWDQPYVYLTVPEEERSRRIELTTDTCILDNEYYFSRGVLEIPIVDTQERFGFGVWVSQKRENFFTYCNHPDSSDIGPFYGWLSTHIDYYSEKTLLLKTMAHFRGGDQRPYIEMEPTDHPLALDQRNGITLAKAWEIVHYYMNYMDKR